MEVSRNVGAITWADLTVKDAERIRDFYHAVVGWDIKPVDMGEYQDYCLSKPKNGQNVAGVCHARGENADIPPVWLMYITVNDLDLSVLECKKRGGKILVPPKPAGGAKRFCVIQDPAGAIVALIEA